MKLAIVISYLIILLFVSGCCCNGIDDNQLTNQDSLSITERNNASDSILINNQSIKPNLSIYRNLMPPTDEESTKMLSILILNDKPVKLSNVIIPISLWVYKGEELWHSKFQTVDSLTFRCEKGPKWEPGTEIIAYILFNEINKNKNTLVKYNTSVKAVY